VSKFIYSEILFNVAPTATTSLNEPPISAKLFGSEPLLRVEMQELLNQPSGFKGNGFRHVKETAAAYLPIQLLLSRAVEGEHTRKHNE
jgi:hypothetical protein